MGYNVQFDVGKVSTMFNSFKLPDVFKDATFVDPMNIWKKVGNHKLVTAYKLFAGEDSNFNAHDALADVVATEKVYNGLLKTFELKHQQKDTVQEFGSLKNHYGKSKKIEPNDNHDFTFKYGKYQGKVLNTFRTDEEIDYLEFMVNKKDGSQSIKDVIKAYLDSRKKCK